MSQFEEDIIAVALGTITTRQEDLLRRLANGNDLVRYGKSAFSGYQRVPVRTIDALLRMCAVKLERGSVKDRCEHYKISETGRKILALLNADTGSAQ